MKKITVLLVGVILTFHATRADLSVAPAGIATNALPQMASPAVRISPAVAEVVRLAESGVTQEVLLAYIRSSKLAFSLSADTILYLRDLGIEAEVITAMLTRDSELPKETPQYAPTTTQPAPTPAEPPATNPPAVEPVPVQPAYVSTAPSDVSYFYNDLAPYGTWVVLDGVGWCWQPRCAVIARSWRPYCDGGRWVYTNCGWYWQSSYSWGWAPFHYGRWYMSDRCGWVWTPDRTWGPAWVSWRVAGDNCGWAALPPRSTFSVAGGWYHNGVSVGVNYSFGLQPNQFTFVSVNNFCQPYVSQWKLAPSQVRTVYNNATVINNTTVVNNTIVNQGVPASRVASVSRREVPKATIRDIPAGQPIARRPGRAENVVFRQELKAPAKPMQVAAQKVDAQHPVVQHQALVPTRMSTPRHASSTRTSPSSTLSPATTGKDSPAKFQSPNRVSQPAVNVQKPMVTSQNFTPSRPQSFVPSKTTQNPTPSTRSQNLAPGKPMTAPKVGGSVPRTMPSAPATQPNKQSVTPKTYVPHAETTWGNRGASRPAPSQPAASAPSNAGKGGGQAMMSQPGVFGGSKGF